MRRSIGMSERLNNFVQDSWTQIKNFSDRFRSGEVKEETLVELGVVREVANVAVEKTREVVGNIRQNWEGAGDNFKDRLVNTFAAARVVVSERVEQLRENVVVRAENIRDRYQNEGIVGATLGYVDEAIDAVRELPSQVGIRINEGRVVWERIKDVEANMQLEFMESDIGDTDWTDSIARLGLVRANIEKRSGIFNQRKEMYIDRLEKMREGRARLAVAKLNMVTATP